MKINLKLASVPPPPRLNGGRALGKSTLTHNIDWKGLVDLNYE